MAFRRFVAVLAIVLAGLASTIAAASAATSQDAATNFVVTVYAPGQTPVPDDTTIGALEQGCPTTDIDPEQNTGGGAPGPGTQLTSDQEWAVATVISQCLPTPIPIAAVSEVTVLESNGQADPNPADALTPADLTLPSDFADSSEWPVFSDVGDEVIYERPSRGPDDANGEGQITVSPGGSLAFDVFEGAAPATVTISASSTTIVPGSPVTFTASVPGASGPETLDWNFGGAAPAATGSSATVSFADPGAYEVTVTATGSVDGQGETEVQVGSVPAATGTTTTPSGPAQSVGTTPGAPIRKVTPRRRHKPVAVAPALPNSAAATRTTAGPAVSTAKSSVAPAGGGGGTSRAVKAPGEGRRKVSGSPASGPATAVRRSRRLVVVGRVLGAVEVVAPGRAGDGSGSGQAPAVNRPVGGWPWAAILGGLAVVSLLGLGAGRELNLIRWAP